MKFAQLIIILFLSNNLYAQKICFEKGGKIFVTNIDGSNAKSITKGTEPSLSPDNKIIVFTLTGNNGIRHIAYINANGGMIKQFKKIPKVESYEPKFSSNGKYIIFNYRVSQSNPSW